MIKVGFLEDDQAYLHQLKQTIHLEPNIQCVYAQSTIADFWKRLPPKLSVDLLFLDIMLPDGSGIDQLGKLNRRFPRAKIIMHTQIEEQKALLKSFSNGAAGYLLKDFPPHKLPSFIQTVYKGGALLSPRMARWLIQHFQPKVDHQFPLTEKEVQLLRFFAEGYSYEETAQFMGVSIDGVKYHVKNIYNKLNVNNKVDAIRILNNLDSGLE